jgi:DnaK suppressor protein
MSVNLPEGYVPNEKEEYMSEKQIEFFRQKLLSWKEELIGESRDTLDHLREENWHEADESDRATTETDAAYELRTRDRYRKLIQKIDEALQRINAGEYGYCQETGDPIGIKRLLARPVAAYTIEAQERYEKYERNHSDED